MAGNPPIPLPTPSPPSPAIAQLDRSFGIPGVARVLAGRGGLAMVRIGSGAGGSAGGVGGELTGEMYVHGGQITSWTPPGAREVLFLSGKSKFEPGKAIRGGVPICFPWFGDHPADPKAPAHGTVRTREWALDSVARLADGAVAVSMSTAADAASRRWNPGEFRLRHRATFGAQLLMELEVTNTGREPFRFEQALHTYFAVRDVEAAVVRGLEGKRGGRYRDKTDAGREKVQAGPLEIRAETDRVFLAASGDVELMDGLGGRRIVISKVNSANTVVWNPWKSKAAAMSDLEPDDWKRMLCIESANVGEAAISLAPGESYIMGTTIRVSHE